MILTDQGNLITIRLRFMPSQEMWVMGFTWGDIEVEGIALVCAQNVLRNLRNLIPFGIMIRAIDSVDPYRSDDFISGRCDFVLLNSSDVQAVEAAYFS